MTLISRNSLTFQYCHGYFISSDDTNELDSVSEDVLLILFLHTYTLLAT